VILAALAMAVSAPAFDCAKATSTVERLICADEELSAVDRAVGRLYAGVRRSGRSRLSTSQSNWLKQRDDCRDKSCLIAEYDDRLFELFAASATPTRNYESAQAHGSLSLLDLGSGWFAFNVVALWIGPSPGAVNDVVETGHFKLVDGKAERAPTEDECGWRVQRLPRDKWRIQEIPFAKNFGGCGGWNATITGTYSR
jgi:uncharacterized protein